MSLFHAIQFLDPLGVPYGIPEINGKPRVSAMPYLFDIAEGNVPNHSEWERFGYNGDVDTGTEEDIWTAGGTYVFPAAAQQMELVSSSASDTLLGTGIQTVTLYYLDDTYAAQTEDIDLNGVGVVTTAANNILRVNSLKAKAVGTGGVAAGTISIRNLADTPIYSQIQAGQTRSRNSIYTVPLGQTLYITSLVVGCGGITTATALITLRATYDHEAMATRTFFLPHAEMQVGIGAGGWYRPFEVPIKLPETVDIKCSATVTANNCTVSAGLRGWLE